MSDKVSRRLLFLLPFPPRTDAAHGGGRALSHLLLELCERHRIALVYLRALEEPPLEPALARRCDLTLEVTRPTPPTAGLSRYRYRSRVWAGQLWGIPEWATAWAVPAYAHQVRAVTRHWQPDVIQVEFQVMAQYLPALAPTPALRVLTAHEPAAAAAREQVAFQKARQRPRAWLDAWAWSRFERRACAQVDAVVVFTERDRQELRDVASPTPVVQIPLGVVVQDEAPAVSRQSVPAVLFVGSFAHAPNVDAAFRLTDAIFPSVHEQHPEAQLWIVGSEPPPTLRARQGKGIIITGHVPDVGPYLEQAAVVAVPLHMGGGMRIKVLEALAAGKALVATRRAVAGLEVAEGRHFVLAESDEAFSREISRLLSRPETRAALERNAWVWTQKASGPGRTATLYEQLYSQRLSAPTRRAQLTMLAEEA